MNKIVRTDDGSNTLFNETIGEHYHSIHGALQESKHVFVNAGLKFILNHQDEASILEIGLGTGLNFLLTLDHCVKNNIRLSYTGIEAFPLGLDELMATGYDQYVPAAIWNSLKDHYQTALRTSVLVFPDKKLCIEVIPLDRYHTDQKYDLIYYDAFSVQHQPEMWTDEIVSHTCSFLKTGGTLVTYAITGKLKRLLKSIGFKIEKLPGAPGKREMLRAVKG